MTQARRVLPDTSHLITRRVLERRLLLKPSPFVNQLVLYALAVAAQRYGVLIHAIVVEATHYHLELTDPHGRLPAFERDLNSLIARALNAHYGRGEYLWCPGSYSNIELPDREAVIEKLLYLWTNPTKDGLVARLEDWPGLKTTPEDLGRELVVERPEGAFFGGRRAEDCEPTYVPVGGGWRGLEERNRARRARDRREVREQRGDGRRRRRRPSALPERVTLRITPPPLLAPPGTHLDELRAELRRRLDARIAEIHAERAARGLHQFMGAARILRQNPFRSLGQTFPKFGLNPRLCGRSPAQRIERIRELQGWRAAYALAREAWSAGNRRVQFPHGTYGMRVYHAARVRPPP